MEKNKNMESEKIKKNKVDCIFCQGQSPYLQNDLVYAMFDAFPVTKFHSLIIPKRHAVTFFDLTREEKNRSFDLIDKVRESILVQDKTITGFNVGFNAGWDAGQTVLHCHIHVIPRRNRDVTERRGGVRNVIPGKGKY